MATTTPTIVEVLCVACDGETDKFVNDYEGHCEECYMKKYHIKEWYKLQEERQWEQRRLMAEMLEDADDSDDELADEHKCVLCDETFKEKGGYYNLYKGEPMCYECYDEDNQ